MIKKFHSVLISTFYSTKKIIKIVLPLFLIPTISKFVYLLNESLIRSNYLKYIFFNFIEDLLVAIGALFFITLFARKIDPKFFITKILVTFMLFLLQTIYIFDLFLLNTIDIRASVQNFLFLLDGKVFFDSIPESKLILFFAILSMNILFSFFFAIKFLEKTKSIKIQKLGLLLIILIASDFGLNLTLNKSVKYNYYTKNYILHELKKGIKTSFNINQLSKDNQEPFNRLDQNKSENFISYNKDPYKKKTISFKGKKLFNIRINKKEKPNVFFVFLESFRRKNIGALGASIPASPNFDRWSKKGILFSNFYANGVQTTRAVLASLFGVIPRHTEKSVQSDTDYDKLIGLPEIFKSEGYKTVFFHNGSLKFEKKDIFFSKNKFDEIHGAKNIIKQFPKHERTSWGVHDEYLMDYISSWLDKNKTIHQPIMATLFTVSHHHPWKLPKSYTPPDFPKTKSAEYDNFLKTFHYSDHCLNIFLESLKKSGLDKNSIVFILSDTSNPQGEHDNNHMLIKNIYEENLQIPFLILAEERIEKAALIDTLASQIDILPTVLDIFSIKTKNYSMGKSLVRKQDDNNVFANNPFELKYWTMIKNKRKYVLIGNKEKVVYDLKNDVLEKFNIFEAHRDNKYFNKLQRQIKYVDAFHKHMKKIY